MHNTPPSAKIFLHLSFRLLCIQLPPLYWLHVITVFQKVHKPLKSLKCINIEKTHFFPSISILGATLTLLTKLLEKSPRLRVTSFSFPVRHPHAHLLPSPPLHPHGNCCSQSQQSFFFLIFRLAYYLFLSPHLFSDYSISTFHVTISPTLQGFLVLESPVCALLHSPCMFTALILPLPF